MQFITSISWTTLLMNLLQQGIENYHLNLWPSLLGQGSKPGPSTSQLQDVSCRAPLPHHFITPCNPCKALWPEYLQAVTAVLINLNFVLPGFGGVSMEHVQTWGPFAYVWQVANMAALNEHNAFMSFSGTKRLCQTQLIVPGPSPGADKSLVACKIMWFQICMAVAASKSSKPAIFDTWAAEDMSIKCCAQVQQVFSKLYVPCRNWWSGWDAAAAGVEAWQQSLCCLPAMKITHNPDSGPQDHFVKAHQVEKKLRTNADLAGGVYSRLSEDAEV